MNTIPENVEQAIQVIASYLKEVPAPRGGANAVIFDDGSITIYDDFGTYNDEAKGVRIERNGI